MATSKKILCALDLSEDSNFIVSQTIEFAKLLNAEILAVYAAPPLTQYVGFQVPANAIERFANDIMTGAENSMKNFLQEHFKDIPAKGKVVRGYAADEILQLIETENIDLVIMGTHGRKGLDRIIFGSVAERIVKMSPVPVLTVRPKK